jgi:radical SAM superfamily enzyme YgiQ (UPF0313 family)
LKILLIYPYFLEARIHVEEISAVPMGLYYVGAMLKSHGYDVEIINWHRRPDSMDAIKEALVSKHPDVIGFSIVHANRWGAIDIAELAKQIDPNIKIVLGGIGATFLWHHLLTHFKTIDFVVLGEGERTFLKLITALEHQESIEQIAHIAGLALRIKNDAVRTASFQPIQDLDTLPAPAQYFDFQHLSVTRGCPGRCTFCSSPKFWGRRVRAHSADYFVKQLAALTQRGINFFYFSDDTFTLNPQLVIEICRKILNLGLLIHWQAISKVNAVSARMLRWMRKAGCVQISFGVESGSARIRRLLCKDIRTEQIQRAFKLTTAHGILARAYLIYGAPTETIETIEQSLKLLYDIKPLSAVFYILALFPGTALYEEFKARTGLDDDIWLQRIEDILYFEHDPELDQQLICDFGHRLRTTFHKWLPEFARDIELTDDANLKQAQADFLSRLGMTFSHGDYAAIETNTDTSKVAVELFNRALRLSPDHRAYWGIAMVYQRWARWDQAIDVLNSGLDRFPASEPLSVCMGISLMNIGQFQAALDYLLPHADSPQASIQIERCRRALRHAKGDAGKS